MQATLFDYLYPTFKIDKPIRLIELFAGVGSQAMALRDIGADFEHYKVVEFDKFAIASYNAIHGTEFETTDITEIKGKDLEIVDTDDYCYILTYSFPCQDLSVAGNQKGMKKGSGTRSGLLWEVERLLNETEELPQVLLMENVPQVIADANIDDFHKWQDFLIGKGYTNYVDTLNAKDFGVAQNRNRTFMVSLLGEWNYKFPKTIRLEKTMKDYLEDEVDEKFYIDSDKTKELINQLIDRGQLEDKHIGKANQIGYPMTSREFVVQGFKDVSPTLCARDYKDPKIVCEERTDEGIRTFKDGCVGTLRTIDACGDKRVVEINRLGNIYGEDKGTGYAGNVWGKDGLCPTITTMQGGNREPMIVASRGRNKDNPSDRTPGAEVEQRLEPNSEGICNTLTSVQKDNYVLEPIIIGGMQKNQSVKTDGVCTTLTSSMGTGGGYVPMITKPTVMIKQATKEGYIECKLGGVADLSFPDSKTRRGRVQDNGDTCPTLTAAETGICRIETPYRIRKLTPLECWRLMDFTDEDFRKAEKVNSNSQLYKQAGNSIVKAVLVAIFKQMM